MFIKNRNYNYCERATVMSHYFESKVPFILKIIRGKQETQIRIVRWTLVGYTYLES